MEESGKERPESGKDAFPNEAKYAKQGLLHWLTPPYRPLVEVYEAGELYFAVQLTAEYVISGRWETRHFVAIIEHPCRYVSEHRHRAPVGFHEVNVAP